MTKFGNRSEYCDYNRNGDGTGGASYLTSSEPDYACRIRNYNYSFRPLETTADQLLASEIDVCAPVWPIERCPVEQARQALRQANRTYRQHLRNRKAAFFQSEQIHWDVALQESRRHYSEARRNLREYLHTLELTECNRWGIFYTGPHDNGEWFRSGNTQSSGSFNDPDVAAVIATEQEKRSNASLKYSVRLL